MTKTLDDYLNDPRIKDEPMGLRMTHAMRFKVQDDMADMTLEEESSYHQERAKSAFSRLGMVPKYTGPHRENA
jgi:hypothetical protein